MRACSLIAERSLFYIKTVPTSAMRACYQIAERSLFYEKTWTEAQDSIELMLIHVN